MAYFQLNELGSTIKPLKLAVELEPNRTNKARYLYILGQVLESQSKTDSASIYFKKVAQFHRKIPRKFYLNAKLKTLLYDSSENTDKEIQIKKMIDNYENEDFLDKIYYKYISNTPNDVIESLWNWTTLQNYCEVNNIKPYYTFMFEHDKEMLLDDDIGESWAWKHLRKNIIRDNVLTSITKYLEEDSHKNLFMPDGHPNKRGHKVFNNYLIKSLTSI